MLAVGSKAPAFRVKDHLGREVSLADLAGKNVILWFYPKADTPGCTIEGCGYRDLSGDFEKKNAVILGVSFDTIEENAAFAAKMQFPYRLLCDTGRAMTELRQDLASLRIDREAPARRRPRWPIVLVLAFVIGGAAFFALRDRLAPQGIVVETVRAAIAPV